MTHESLMQRAFERECGDGVRWAGVTRTGSEVRVSFVIVERGSKHTIGTRPKGTGRLHLEEAATQAGRWAAVMAKQAAA